MQQSSASTPPSGSAGSVDSALSSLSTRYLARQPILDSKGRVVAYELLSRSDSEALFVGSGPLASWTVIDNATMYGLGKLTAGLPAFINCTADTLLSGYIPMLPAASTILEILEDVDPTDEVVNACKELRRRGFKIALDDFDYRPSLDALIGIADFIKVDFHSTDTSKRRMLRAALREFRGVYVAEKVETQEEYERAQKEGFTLFQGYYFCKPFPLERAVVPSNRIVHLRLLNLLHKNPLDIGETAELVKSEPSLAYRLLRYVNSAGFGVGQHIDSIETALLVVGDDQFRRMATLAVAVELNVGPSPEILRMALVRARFCEIAASVGELNPTEQYLLGLFSLLDAMLQLPMEAAIAPLSLATSIRAALLRTEDRGRAPLDWIEAYEHGDFFRCDEIATCFGLPSNILAENFSAATLWADELLATN